MKGKKSEKTKLQKKADDLWSVIIRNRDLICRLCKSRPSRDAHHIFARSHKNTRHDIRNGLGLCYTCHQPEGHNDPCNFRERIVEEIGAELYDLMKQKHLVKVKYNEAFLRDRIDYLQKIDKEHMEKRLNLVRKLSTASHE